MADAIDWPTLAGRPALVALDNKQGGVYVQVFEGGRALESPSIEFAECALPSFRRHIHKRSRRRIADAGGCSARRWCRRRGDRRTTPPDGERSGRDRRPPLAGGRAPAGATRADLSAKARDRAELGESFRRMIEPIAIEGASPADAEAIAALYRASFGEQGWAGRAVAELIGQSSAICRVGRSKAGLAGYALCRLAADECEVLSCAVAAGFRRHGAARLLLEAVFDEAACRGGALGLPGSRGGQRTSPGALRCSRL